MKKQRRYISVAVAVLISLSAAACTGESVQNDEPPAPTAAPAPTAEVPPAVGAEPNAVTMQLNFAPEFNKAGKPYTPLDIEPGVADYTIAEGLMNVANRDAFTLTPAQVSKLVENGFVVTPTDEQQLFYIYEYNDYENIPTFVTTDSVLQAYHVFFGYALRTAEAESFYPLVRELNGNMLGKAIELYEAAAEPYVKEQALKVAGYFAVAERLLGGEAPAGALQAVMPAVEAELELISAAAGHGESPLMGCTVDYSQFTVRGHYTRSELLGQYFSAMSWYGVVPFPFYDQFGERDEDSAIRAVLMSIALCALAPADGGELWESVYSPTAFFVGNADDITPFQLAQAVTRVYGSAPDIDALPDRLDELYAEADKLPKPQIVSKNALDENGPQIRFMGQRYIPDSEILQELCEPLARPFPSGLDVLAVLGWERAAEHLERYEKPSELWPGYGGAFTRMRDKFTSLEPAQWQSNLYYAWLYTINSLKEGCGAGYPRFMQSDAWMDKNIATALASWAELRHDTILYGKSSAAEMGGGFDEVLPAYVEPNAEVYNKLLWMTVFARENLSARGILHEELRNKMEGFELLLGFLLDCSVRELRGEDLTEDEYNTLRAYGGWLEQLTCSMVTAEDGIPIGYWYEIVSDTDRNMAVVADVHTATVRGEGTGFYLEEGVGHAAEIYVVFPAKGKLYLGRGACFDYYEFISDTRLTDEQWQQQLVTSPPERPIWTGSYIAR